MFELILLSSIYNFGLLSELMSISFTQVNFYGGGMRDNDNSKNVIVSG